MSVFCRELITLIEKIAYTEYICTTNNHCLGQLYKYQQNGRWNLGQVQNNSIRWLKWQDGYYTQGKTWHSGLNYQGECLTFWYNGHPIRLLRNFLFLCNVN